jgi:pantothenate kinase type III
MLLTVDVGNTNTVLGLFEDHQLAHSWRITTHARGTADEMALTFRGLLTEVPEITGIALCSTVPSVLREMRTMFARYWDHVPTVIVEPGTKTGVPLLTDNPKEVGADRIVNTLAAHHLFGGPAIVVDFGTSTNLDVVSVKGEFLGGALAPGIEISLDALASRAAQLRKVELVPPPVGDREEHGRGAAVRRALRVRRPGGRPGRPDHRRARWTGHGRGRDRRAGTDRRGRVAHDHPPRARPDPDRPGPHLRQERHRVTSATDRYDHGRSEG